MSTIRVIAGEFRGRNIPYSLQRFGSGDITPQKVKGALFSILGEDLSGKSFLDLFGGSGQIGVEALSRGADSVVFVEADRRRVSFIKEIVDVLEVSDRCRIMPVKAERALKILSEGGEKFDVIFCDPPYEKVKGVAKSYKKLLEGIDESNLPAGDGVIAIQHFGSNILPQSAGSFILYDSRQYGATSLSFYTRRG